MRVVTRWSHPRARLAVAVAGLALCVGVAVSASSGASRAATNVAFVRVNQLGYAVGTPKRAYVIGNVPETGATYTVWRSDGTVVGGGRLGRPAGAWSSRFPDVHVLDFDSVNTPGRYTIRVAGSAPAASPPFTIAAATRVFKPGLVNALAFYREQRDGPDYIRSALRRAPAHLNDRRAGIYLPPRTNRDGVVLGPMRRLPGTIDASGGWWDAGDYLKFVETTSYTVDMMLTGLRDFPAEMRSARQGADFTGEALFGLSWLLRMWDDRTRTLYFQVGIGNGNGTIAADHDIWRLPQADDHFGGNDPLYRFIRHRPVFRAGPPGSRVSPNLAGRDAAAFALCYQVFKRSDAGLAARCLRAAEHIFSLANIHPGQLVTAVPWNFYPETEWRDDLELGAVEIADALRRGPLPPGLPNRSYAYYLRQAAAWAHAYQRQADSNSDPLNLYDVSGLAHYELYRAIGQRPHVGGLEVGRATLLCALRRQLRLAAGVARGDRLNFGYPWNGGDTTSHGAGLAVTASEYALLTGSSADRTWSERWLGNILGANGWGVSLIIGDGTVFPRCPQHQVANLIPSPPLAGAAVEGPAAAAATGFLDGMRRCPPSGIDRFAAFNGPGVFRDSVESFSTVEPAIDLTATSPLAFAWQIASDPR